MSGNACTRARNWGCPIGPRRGRGRALGRTGRVLGVSGDVVVSRCAEEWIACGLPARLGGSVGTVPGRDSCWRRLEASDGADGFGGGLRLGAGRRVARCLPDPHREQDHRDPRISIFMVGLNQSYGGLSWCTEQRTRVRPVLGSAALCGFGRCRAGRAGPRVPRPWPIRSISSRRFAPATGRFRRAAGRGSGSVAARPPGARAARPGGVGGRGPERVKAGSACSRRTRENSSGTPDQKQRGRVDVPQAGARAVADPSWGNEVGPQ